VFCHIAQPIAAKSKTPIRAPIFMATLPACEFTPEQIASAVLEQIPQITFANTVYNMRKNPYASLYEGGTFENFQGDRLITAVMDRIVSGYSMVRPAAINASAACGTQGPMAEYGQTTFTSFLKDLRGESPLVCINKARQTVVDGYQMATMAMRNTLKDLFMVEQRINLVDRSGLKFVARQASGIAGGLSGGENVADAPWNGNLPDSPMTFQALLQLSELLRYTYNTNIEMFGEGDNEYFSVIVSMEQSNRFRNEASVLTDFRSATTGGYNDAKNELWNYAFNPLYRGIRVGIDTQPLRFSNLNADGSPQYIEPFVRSTNVDGGTARNSPNPEWLSAPYEVGLIIAKNTFQWRVPQRLASIGDMKWPMNFTTGELQWIDDWRVAGGNCNKYGEFGQFIWDLQYMVSPKVPHGVIPFAYTRCQTDLGFNTCSNISGSGSSFPL
jgi:hypothetical protein